MYPIFISYRRSDLSLEAEWLYNVISTFFGEKVVFFDKSEIEGGKLWDETLRTCISSAKVVLVLIGPKWLKEQLQSGMRRLDDPEDWVRQEVMSAIEAFRVHPEERWIFSVLVNGASLPRKEWLPKDLAELASFQLELKLQFDIKDYIEAARDVYSFINEQLFKLLSLKLVSELKALPFEANKVPNPYELTGFQLPEELRNVRPEIPFKGLEHFTKEDAPIFFGRRKETAEIIDFFKKSQTLIRLYGQSGVGKSSLLFAGLLPRLQSRGWKVIYLRRNPKEAYPTTLEHAIKPFCDLLPMQLFIIIDQVEETITAPNLEAKSELEDLAEKIKELLSFNTYNNNKVRFIISYRKEYDVNIKTQLAKKFIDSDEYWLKDLDYTGMQEAIQGITKDQRLIDKYHLEIEKDLPDFIIKDLHNSSTQENVTPLLQIILRKMWDRVANQDIDNRIFSIKVYEECKSRDLQEFVQEQFNMIRINNVEFEEAITSGLALDVIRCFTSDADTSVSKNEQAILELYQDEQLIKGLLQAFVNTYLPVRLENKDYRLPHDSLARAVRIRYTSSQLPGQRASRLLESKNVDIYEKPNEVGFSKEDLTILDGGKQGMRKWTEKQREIIQKNREQRLREALELAEKNRKLVETNSQLEFALKEAKEQTAQARAKAFAATAREIVQTDLTMALRLAEVACAITSEPTKEAKSAMLDILKSKGPFYKKTLDGANKFVEAVAFSPDGKFILISTIKALTLWNSDGTLYHTFDVKLNQPVSMAFSPDSKAILFAGFNQYATLTDLKGNVSQSYGQSSSLAFSPDGKIILTGGFNKVHLWNLERQSIRSIEAHPMVMSVAFSPTGKYILTGGTDSVAKLWSINGILERSFAGHNAVVSSVAFSPDGEYIITGSDYTARLWNLDGTLKKAFEGHTGIINSVSFSPNGQLILTTGSDRTATLWNLDGTLRQSFPGSDLPGMSAAFSPSEPLIVATSGKTAKLWYLEGIMKQSIITNYCNNSVAFSDNREIIVTRGGDLPFPNSFNKDELWNLDETLNMGQHSQNIPATSRAKPEIWLRRVLRSFHLLPRNSKHILENSSKPYQGDVRANNPKVSAPGETHIISKRNFNKEVKVWTLKGSLKEYYEEDNKTIELVAFSPNGKLIVTGCKGLIKMWNSIGNLQHSFEAHEGLGEILAFSPDGNTILTASSGTIKLWNLNGTLKKFFDCHRNNIKALAFNPEGNLIVTATEGEIEVWDLDQILKKSFEKHHINVEAISFSSNGKFVLTASKDTIMLWNVNGNLKHTFSMSYNAIEKIAFSPDGESIILANNNPTAELWDCDGVLKQTFKGHKDLVECVTFSSDGNFILTGSRDNTAKLWNLNGTLKQSFEGHTNIITSVAFSQDCKLILTGSWDRTVKVWRPFWEILSPKNTEILNSVQMKEYEIPENIAWGKIW